MSFIEHLNLLMRMDQLIRLKATGTPKEFAQRLGISVAGIYRHLEELEGLGASVVYCRLRQSFHYETEGRLYVTFLSNEEGGGGSRSFIRDF